VVLTVGRGPKRRHQEPADEPPNSAGQRWRRESDDSGTGRRRQWRSRWRCRPSPHRGGARAKTQPLRARRACSNSDRAWCPCAAAGTVTPDRAARGGGNRQAPAPSKRPFTTTAARAGTGAKRHPTQQPCEIPRTRPREAEAPAAARAIQHKTIWHSRALQRAPNRARRRRRRRRAATRTKKNAAPAAPQGAPKCGHGPRQRRRAAARARNSRPTRPPEAPKTRPRAAVAASRDCVRENQPPHQPPRSPPNVPAGGGGSGTGWCVQNPPPERNPRGPKSAIAGSYSDPSSPPGGTRTRPRAPAAAARGGASENPSLAAPQEPPKRPHGWLWRR